jgi:hypothetical protein
VQVTRLTGFDKECGRAIDAAFSDFQGRDASPALARVFATLVHRKTQGLPDLANNPMSLKGAGWVGFAGLRKERGNAMDSNVATFSSLRDGCRAVALVCQFREHAPVQLAYRTSDPIALARALEASQWQAVVDLSGFEDEIRELGGGSAPIRSLRAWRAAAILWLHAFGSMLDAAGVRVSNRLRGS